MAQLAQSHDGLLADIDSTETVHGKAAFWWLGQLSFVVKVGDVVIYLDPYLADHPARQTPPLLRPSEVTNATVCTGSHDHGDHIDPASVPGIAAGSARCKFVVPNPHVKRMTELGCASESIVGLRPDETAVVAGVKITGLKAKHESFDESELGFPHLGYVFEASGVCFYHSGDTLIYEGLIPALRQWEKIDAMFLPINGRDGKRYRSGCLGNMTFQEAVDLAGETRPQLVVPAHYDMFANNQGDPEAFADYLNAKFADIPCWIGPAGQKVVFGGPWSDDNRTA